MLEDIDEHEAYDTETDEPEEMDGYTIIDESGAELDKKKRDISYAESDEPTVGSEIPENEMTVILDNPASVLPQPGAALTIRINENLGAVYFEGKKVGDFKSALIAKLKAERNGSFVSAKMFSDHRPVMVKLSFLKRKSKNSVKLEFNGTIS